MGPFDKKKRGREREWPGGEELEELSESEGEKGREERKVVQ
jgi:hypothetical protein